MGVSYAFSKYMDFTGIPEYANLRSYAYGLDSIDQTHNMTINFTYNIPNATKLVKNKVIGYAFDHWVLSGISQFASGMPAAISFTTTNSENLNGGGDAQRVDVVGNAFSGNIHTFYQWFNTAAFALPGMNDPGNAGKYDVRQPGVNNNDMAISKNFPIKKREALSLASGGKLTTSSITRSMPPSIPPQSYAGGSPDQHAFRRRLSRRGRQG